MALGEQNKQGRKYYLSIVEGSLVHKEKGEKSLYSFVSGFLERIYQQERTFNGEDVAYWYINIRGEKGELYSLCLPFRSGVFKSIVLSLASVENLLLEPIKIEPYKKGDYTRVNVYSGERKLDWIVKELPAVEELVIAGQKVKDDTRRMALIARLVEKINERLA